MTTFRCCTSLYPFTFRRFHVVLIARLTLASSFVASRRANVPCYAFSDVPALPVTCLSKQRPCRSRRNKNLPGVVKPGGLKTGLIFHVIANATSVRDDTTNVYPRGCKREFLTTTRASPLSPIRSSQPFLRAPILSSARRTSPRP